MNPITETLDLGLFETGETKSYQVYMAAFVIQSTEETEIKLNLADPGEGRATALPAGPTPVPLAPGALLFGSALIALRLWRRRT